MTVLTAIIAVFASTGFWAFIQTVWSKKSTRKSAEARLIMGIGFSKITDLGMKYIDRGYITQQEYHDLYHYLYEPYREMGGNGTAEKIMDQVGKLPFKEGL